MLSERDKKTIMEISKQYQARRVLLFGSSLDPKKESHDIDIGVEGLSPQVFFKYYGDLLLRVSKPIDIVDLSDKSAFIKLIEREGLLLYG